MTPYVKKDDYFSKALENFTYKNKIYAVPRDVSNLVIYYNKNLFDKYKIKYPQSGWSMQDYLDTAKKFAQKGIWGTSYETDMLFWSPYLMSNGASVLSDDGRKILLDTKKRL